MPFLKGAIAVLVQASVVVEEDLPAQNRLTDDDTALTVGPVGDLNQDVAPQLLVRGCVVDEIQKLLCAFRRKGHGLASSTLTREKQVSDQFAEGAELPPATGPLFHLSGYCGRQNKPRPVTGITRSGEGVHSGEVRFQNATHFRGLVRRLISVCATRSGRCLLSSEERISRRAAKVSRRPASELARSTCAPPFPSRWKFV
jgi:hypothetical protein